MEYILIDPQMFTLAEPKDILCNIDFFTDIIELSNSRIIIVCLYKEIIDKLLATPYQPFPINLNDIRDDDLKQKLILLNANFNRTIMNNYKKIDIDSCYGNQLFSSDRSELENTDEYFAFFNMLLTACYCKDGISDKVFVGIKSSGICEGETTCISCRCEIEKFQKQFNWIAPNNFLSNEQKAKKKLREIVHKKAGLFISSPEVKKSNHHNHIQKEDFSTYEQLSLKNRRVLNYLRYYGLSKIEFKDFAPDTSKETGTIKLIKLDEYDNTDVISGWLYACLEFRILVELYFPKGVGQLLYTINTTEFTSKNMDELKSALSI